ncbi:MAG: S-methyl-5-thioribose-1-phosphate isomerase [Gammaproteobacteria bacterium]
MRSEHDTVRAVEWRDDILHLLDQRALPGREAYLAFSDAAAVAEAIRAMVVRGAPAIGITAAYAVVLAARQAYASAGQDWVAAIEPDMRRLAESRPTAVNLFWALARLRARFAELSGDPVPALLDEASALHAEDIQANRRMGEAGAALLGEVQGVLTHCNTGSLATGGYGTALGVIRSAWAGRRIRAVYADETRPWLQGSRLTAWELVRDGIPVTLLADGAAAQLMREGRVQWVIVGADRIAANGDVANKIGTYSLAVSARYHGVRFMVVAPTSTLDMSLAGGEEIPIENRPADEVLSLAGQPVAAAGAEAWNPAFDITPAALIDAIVTERGTVECPDAAGMAALLASGA